MNTKNGIFKKRILKGEAISSLTDNQLDQHRGGTVITSLAACLGLTICITGCQSNSCPPVTQSCNDGCGYPVSDGCVTYTTSQNTCDQTQAYCC